MREHPEYGLPKFAIVWYSSEPWAILCTATEAVLIPTLEISGYKRKKEDANDRIQTMQRLWNASETSLRVPISQVADRIA